MENIPRKPGRPSKYPANWTNAQKQAARRMAKLDHPLDDLVPPPNLEAKFTIFNYSKVEVADYLARVVFGHHMDYAEAIKFLRPKADMGDCVALAADMENNEYVRAAMERLFKSLGIDDESRKQFVQEIWKWFYGSDTDLKLQASRVLAKVFFGEDKQQPAAESLKIEGLEGGLERMFSQNQREPEVAEVRDEPEVIETNATYIMKGRHE